MKIAQFNTHDIGGAGKAAFRLNLALNSHGIDSQLFVKHKMTKTSEVVEIKSPEVHNRLFDSIAQKYFYTNIKPGNTISSILYPGIGLNYLDDFQNFDLFHLHWISSFISLEAIMQLRSMGKPIVWTLHDQNPFTGACHYTHGCDRYKDNCSACPQLVENGYDITRHLLHAKLEHLPEDITIVAPSQWLADSARESRLLKNHRIEVISNSVETDIYRPMDKTYVKSLFGLKPNVKVLLFGAQEMKEKRKGFEYLSEAARILKQDSYIQDLLNRDELCILVFGHPSPQLQEMNLPYKALGYLHDDRELAKVYAAADVLALPSLEDNQPNIMLESLSSGTPVVGFRTGGIGETILDGQNGYTCSIGDAGDFADKIAVALKKAEFLREHCRQYAVDKFSLERQAARFTELYSEILSRPLKPYRAGKISPILPELTVPLMNYVREVSMDLQRESEALAEENAGLVTERNNLAAERNNLNALWGQAIADNEKLNQQLEGLRQDKAALIMERDHIWAQYSQIRNSKSWRATAPLRFAARFIKKTIKFWLPYALVRYYQKRQSK